MSGAEFLEHLADYRLSPWGEERNDLRAAAQMSVVSASQGGKLTRKKAFESLQVERRPYTGPEQSDEQMKAMLRKLG